MSNPKDPPFFTCVVAKYQRKCPLTRAKIYNRTFDLKSSRPFNASASSFTLTSWIGAGPFCETPLVAVGLTGEVASDFDEDFNEP